MKTIAAITGGRSDYGLLLPVLRGIAADPALRLAVHVTGMHLEPRFGDTVRLVEADGLPIGERVPIDLKSDDPAGIAHAMARALGGFGKVFAKQAPDILLVLGDRFEILAGVAAAVPFNIPIAHIHGGDVTEGAIDDAMRHAISKMSHLHFVSAELHRERLLQMGEEPWRVHVTGAPGLDNLRTIQFLTRTDLERLVGIRLEPPPLLVTYHPETLDHQNAGRHARELLAALEDVKLPIVFTAPNADTAGSAIREEIERFVQRHANARLVASLGTQAYFSLMKLAAAMVGNSSSGLVEAPSFELPAVDVGDRQKGRLRTRNVVPARPEKASIATALAQALAPGFRSALRGLANPYGDGHAAERIVQALREAPERQELLYKRFASLSGPQVQASGSSCR